ncbi:uncharacterized protein VDAG_09120 [Verticillium dahliae VdLs.17]|uniref:Uncharacterized protein n=1 Tax=Verticillium dahliae (strain VdLs.17 / ATCC MYA-4575 / FGSC 10137) TaxID=498257 RepID=G2XFJ6_VERDV|nr:uncharacterized protein VDAG_09120 [Verticillium dahliae VdLs.17]EGY18594.1 hypothetical protein VDAG_09120 [Verticillium dahliae VdLs.17]KAH6669082.1 hypothetical protein EV126DRAFT_351982 [Verticillium dahliae]KAH6691993.1 hypothetical protein EV126DRAFT_347199 [Verticillium dahliae]
MSHRSSDASDPGGTEPAGKCDASSQGRESKALGLTVHQRSGHGTVERRDRKRRQAVVTTESRVPNRRGRPGSKDVRSASLTCTKVESDSGGPGDLQGPEPKRDLLRSTRELRPAACGCGRTLRVSEDTSARPRMGVSSMARMGRHDDEGLPWPAHPP